MKRLYSDLKEAGKKMINYNSATRYKMDAYYKVKRVDYSKVAQRSDGATSGYGNELQGYSSLSELCNALFGGKL